MSCLIQVGKWHLCVYEDGFHGKDVHTLNKDGRRQQQQQQHSTACGQNMDGVFSNRISAWIPSWYVVFATVLWKHCKNSRELIVAIVTVMLLPTHTHTTMFKCTMCLCSVLSCPLPSEPPTHVEGSVRLRRETPGGPPEGPPHQGGPRGGSRGPSNRQWGGSYPTSGENHTGHRGTSHRWAELVRNTWGLSWCTSSRLRDATPMTQPCVVKRISSD